MQPAGQMQTESGATFAPPGTGSVQTARVGAREQAEKDNEQVLIHP